MTSQSIPGNASINQGQLWNRLHDEREEVCEALIHGLPSAKLKGDEQACRNVMQARLAKIDSALDRVTSGSSTFCGACGKELDSMWLEVDPAATQCAACEQAVTKPFVRNNHSSDSHVQIDEAEGLSISTCQPFDTIHIETGHSNYRLFLIDPVTGRSLIEGGRFFLEPTEATILGSSTRTAAFRSGWIGIGFRLEIWAVEQLISTSAVNSVKVEHSTAGIVASESTKSYC